ncbi:disease resistance CC-NBS-LRR class family protein [Tanacetum coccineum]|uniref:Disease resistance CC-NBS-LRR class family protein n=1 Tax=Tanacetum coccineum TaxID=301880 RepID=A0ABQ5CL93_9ASTR
MHRITPTNYFVDTITDAEMLEKTFSTFHASNILLQQQYRAKGFTNTLSEANATTYEIIKRHRILCHGHGQGRGFGRGDFQGVNHAQFKNTGGHKKWQDKGKTIKKEGDGKDKALIANACYRCGSFNHWARLCRTPKHLVDLYQKSIKNKGSGAEANFVHGQWEKQAYESALMILKILQMQLTSMLEIFSHMNDCKPMIMKSKLTVFAWGHAILHAATLIRIRPTSYHTYSPLQLVFGQEPNISHLRIFGCAVYVPIAPPQRTKMGPQRRLGIYVGYDSSSIIKYLEPSTGDLFTARFADCHFDESMFPTLGGEIRQLEKEISWKELSLCSFDPRTKECELEVQKIIHLQRLANQLPDAFTDSKRVTKSHIPAVNAPVKIDVQEGQPHIGNESNARLKRGRPVGSKDKNPRKKKEQEIQDTNRDRETSGSPKGTQTSLEVMENDEDQEPKSMQECRYRNDWPKWKDAIEAELKSLEKRKVFGPIVQTPKGSTSGTMKFLKNQEIDYEETYSPVVDATTLRYLISLVIQEGIDMRLMDVVTAYLYGSLDTEIYMKLPEGFKLPETCKISSREKYAIKLNKSLYGLKQSGRMWYNRLSEYLLKEGYKMILFAVAFLLKDPSEYVIIACYKFEHLKDGILVHQEAYMEKLLKRFYMDKSHSLSNPMVVRTFDVKKDPFRPRDVDEEILSPEVPYF